MNSKDNMFSYIICGHMFHSNIPIPELGPGDDGKPEFIFQLHTAPRLSSKSRNWLNHWYSSDESVWLSFAKTETGYLLHFPAFADFVISTDARTVSCYMEADCPLETMRHLFLNQVIPILLSQLGKLVLHASACATSQGVMAFMGMSGMGKSTLAASFGLRGYSILTDDCLLIEEEAGVIKTIPSYPGLRLWPDTISALFEHEPDLQPLAHYTDKKRLVFDQDSFGGSLALSAIYVLKQLDNMPDTADVIIVPLSASEALLETVKHTFQLDVTDHARLGRSFKEYERLAKAIPFFKLIYPRNHAFLPTVTASILNHLDLIQNRQPLKG